MKHFRGFKRRSIFQIDGGFNHEVELPRSRNTPGSVHFCFVYGVGVSAPVHFKEFSALAFDMQSTHDVNKLLKSRRSVIISLPLEQ